MSDEQEGQTGWHLDKRVPLALILALVVQTGTIIWWASSVSARLDNVERWQAANDETRERLAVLESRLSAIQSGVARIERKLGE